VTHFHRLAIATIERATRDTIIATFAVPATLAPQFRFEPGQHLTLRATIDGQDARRSYSICSGVTDGTLRIAIKRHAGGLFSVWANECWRPGDLIEVMPPVGHFNVPLDAALRRQFVGFAAGSGITPVLSLLRSVLAVEPRSGFTLFYGNRASSTVLFREELAALKDANIDRFAVLHVLSREAQDVELMHGRIDLARAGDLIDRWLDLPAIDAVFVCGPQPMMDGVCTALAQRGYPASRIRVERFAASIPKPAPRPPPSVGAGPARCVVTAVQDGVTRSFPLERGRESILDAGLRAGVDLPYSCKGGVCATCRARLVTGTVDMDANFALEADELARGFVLTCQSHPRSDHVTVDYDAPG
jgi:ring-1,2-phenylacetyl-CoA epoxidase subunit PaaE